MQPLTNTAMLPKPNPTRRRVTVAPALLLFLPWALVMVVAYAVLSAGARDPIEPPETRHAPAPHAIP